MFHRFLSGDNDSFEQLINMHRSELTNFIQGIVHDSHEANHLTIEAFAQLAVGGKKFAGRSSLKTYLFTIGRNLAYKYVKMRGREQHIPFEELIQPLTGSDDSLEDMAMREETKRLLHKAIGELKEEYRAVLILLYFEDMSYIQTGRVLKKSERQIEGLTRRAKVALKKKLEKEGFFKEQI